MNELERFWSKVEIKDETACWEWNAARGRTGYGRFRQPNFHEYAHRAAWRLTHGLIPEGQKVLHKCDNPPCVNPTHLYLGTSADNSADILKRNRYGDPAKRGRKGELHPNAKLTEEDVNAIRKRIADGEKNTMLAREYGVTPALIGHIVKRRAWSHVGDD